MNKTNSEKQNKKLTSSKVEMIKLGQDVHVVR